MTLRHGSSQWAFALATLLIFPAAAPAVTLAGVHLEDSLRVGRQTLQLASCGVRDTLWIDHYVAGLYLPPGSSIQAAKDPRKAKAVRLKVVNARYLPGNIPDKWRGALSTELRHEPMMRVRRAYDGLSDGDVATFTYTPRNGVTMAVNGKTLVHAEGHAVIESILKAWAGKDPIAGKLHRLELQHPCS